MTDVLTCAEETSPKRNDEGTDNNDRGFLMEFNDSPRSTEAVKESPSSTQRLFESAFNDKPKQESQDSQNQSDWSETGPSPHALKAAIEQTWNDVQKPAEVSAVMIVSSNQTALAASFSPSFESALPPLTFSRSAELSAAWLSGRNMLDTHSSRDDAEPGSRQTATADTAERPQENREFAHKLARAAETNALKVHTRKRCYTEVANTLDRFGVYLSGGSAYMAAPQLAASSRFREVSPNRLEPGAVLVFGRSYNHPHGHITVFLGNGMEASDHVQPLVNFGAYGGVRVFIPLN
jgi:hypothetical protein